MIHRLLCAVIFLTAAVAVNAEPALTLAPKYNCAGTNPDGSKYSGTVSISLVSDTTFNVEWNIDGEIYKGFGMHRNDAVAATYTINGQPGLVVYQVKDGTLNGLWTIRGENGNGTEVLTPQ